MSNYTYTLMADNEAVVEQGHIVARSDQDAILRVAKRVYPCLRGHIRRDGNYLAEVATDGHETYADYLGGHIEARGVYQVVRDGDDCVMRFYRFVGPDGKEITLNDGIILFNPEEDGSQNQGTVDLLSEYMDMPIDDIIWELEDCGL